MAHYRCAKIVLVIMAWIVAFAFCEPASAQGKPGGMSLIRDAEIESTLKNLIFPVLDVAGIDRNAFRLFIVQNDDLNAFVAGGQNIFIHTGLLIRSENYDQVMGVIAHETGHIAGGHLARADETLQSLSEQSLVMQVLAAAAFALGRGDAGAAIIAGSGQVFQRNALAFTRTQERSADQAALSFLAQLGVSPQGLLDFFKILQQDQKILLDGRANPYLQSHPLTPERIDSIESYLTAHPALAQKSSNDARLQSMHQRMRAKLIGFMLPATRVLQFYPLSDTSLYAEYARAILYYRNGDLSNALSTINRLIKTNPNDAYFYELRGQMVMETKVKNPNPDGYIADYEKSLSLAPDQPLILLGLVQALINSGRDADVKRALPYLEEVLRLEPAYGLAWRMESIAQGKAGNIGKSALALAELALLQGDKKRAKEQAVRAAALLVNDPIAQRRAEDIKNQIASEEKK